MRIDLAIHFQELSNSENWEKKFENWVEPQKYTELFDKRPDLLPANSTWLAQWNDYRNLDWQQASLYSEQINELNAIYAN